MCQLCTDNTLIVDLSQIFARIKLEQIAS
jgi:hypothetical protein